MKYRYYILIIIMLRCFLTSAQVSRQGTPISFDPDNIRYTIPFFKVEKFDVESFKTEDSINSELAAAPWRFGKNILVDLSPDNLGRWQTLNNGDRLWQLGINSDGAYSLNLTFNKYHLPRGAELYIYNADLSHIIGAFTSENNQDDYFFATTLVRGDSIIVEYYEPKNVDFQGELNISTITHAYRNAFEFARNFGNSGNCNINVACPVARNWQNQVNATVMLLTGGNAFCSGVLVNNTGEDFKPYILTASHCYKNPSTIVAWFNWQNENCRNSLIPPEYDSMSGAQHRARNSTTDFWLIELNQQIPKRYNPYFAGWNRTLEQTLTDTIVGIHHPRGDVKKFSYSLNKAESASYMQDADSGNTHWRIVWSGGTTTEPGSSGSPLFDSKGRIVGQLHGGYAACGNTEPDWYGRFGLSWTGAGTNNSRLRNWLDPDNINVNAINGISYFCNEIKDPYNFKSTALSESTIMLTWNLNAKKNYVLISYNTKNNFGHPQGPYTITEELESGGKILYIGNNECFFHENLNPDSEYFYKIWSFDFGLNYSKGVEANTSTFADNTDIGDSDDFPEPKNLKVVATGAHYVELIWDEPEIMESFENHKYYKIYRNSHLIGKTANREYCETGIPIGKHFYYVTAVYDNPFYESLPSQKVYAEIQEIEPKQLIVEKEGRGVVSPATGTYLFNKNAIFTIVAIPEKHWYFSHFEEKSDTVSFSPAYKIHIEENKHIKAVFKMKEYLISVSSEPENTGVQTGSGTYYPGETAEISTEIPGNYYFMFWTDNEKIVSTRPQLSFPVLSQTHYTANFARKQYVLSLRTCTHEFNDENKNNERNVLNSTNSFISAQNDVLTVRVYPNPAKGSLFVDINNITDSFIIELYNIEGQMILYRAIAQDALQKSFLEKIDVSAYTPGLYLLKANTSASTHTFKILIK